MRVTFSMNISVIYIGVHCDHVVVPDVHTRVFDALIFSDETMVGSFKMRRREANSSSREHSILNAAIFQTG